MHLQLWQRFNNVSTAETPSGARGLPHTAAVLLPHTQNRGLARCANDSDLPTEGIGRICMFTPTANFQPAVRPMLLGVTEAAAALSISRSLLYELMTANAVRSVKIGRRRLVDVQSMKEWHKSLTANEGLSGIENGGAQ
jgi:excisionase family DNA binding protein